jgi:YD repeat-containing protein
MTLYNYDNVTNVLTSTIDSNCKSTYYEYNGLRQLIRIRDNENKILQEFEQNYKRY